MCDFCLTDVDAALRVTSAIADVVKRAVDDSSVSSRVDAIWLSPRTAMACVLGWSQGDFIALYGVSMRGSEMVERNEALVQFVRGTGDGTWNRTRKTFVLGKMCPLLNARSRSVKSSMRTSN